MNNFDNINEYIDKKFKKIHMLKSFQHLYNQGIDFYNKKQYEKAIRFFKFAIEKPKVQPQVYYNLALSYQYLKKYDRAIVTYNKFLALKPNDYDGLYNLALTYYMMENFAKAAEIFEQCISIKKDEDGVKALILTYLGQDEAQKAIDLAEEIFQLSTDGEKLYYAIAKVFETKHSLNKDFTYIDIAIGMFLKIIQNNPKHYDAQLSISICYAKKGEWENSIGFCKTALETVPDSFEANNQMGLIYYCRNEISEAINYYEIALELKPAGDYRIYSNLAYAYEKFGDKKKAIKIFTQLVNKFPQYPARNEVKNHLRILKTMQV